MTQHVLFERRGTLGIATLNRPQALNALSHDMVMALDRQLGEWQQDAAVAAVLIRGAGDRAFCAGGDIRAFYDLRDGGVAELSAIFYRDEYRLNRRIFRYPKPYIALVDGVTMGGGVGISVHGSHWVAITPSGQGAPGDRARPLSSSPTAPPKARTISIILASATAWSAALFVRRPSISPTVI